MGQLDVYEALKENGGWMTSEELRNVLDTSRGAVSRAAGKLMRWGEIISETSPHSSRATRYKIVEREIMRNDGKA